MKIDLDLFKFIVKISDSGTPNNVGSHYFVMVTLFTMKQLQSRVCEYFTN